MAESVSPPNIWTYDQCGSVNTDAINIAKEYKPVGQFYVDACSLINLYGLKAHPVFKEGIPHNSMGEITAFDDNNKKKEPTSVSVNKHRLDVNSMKILFKVLETCPHVTTLK